jgi:hypothetical protein
LQGLNSETELGLKKANKANEGVKANSLILEAQESKMQTLEKELVNIWELIRTLKRGGGSSRKLMTVSQEPEKDES